MFADLKIIITDFFFLKTLSHMLKPVRNLWITPFALRREYQSSPEERSIPFSISSYSSFAQQS